MTIIASILFLITITVVTFSLLATLRSALPHIVDIIENHGADLQTSPTIRTGDIKFCRSISIKNNEPTHLTLKRRTISKLPVHVARQELYNDIDWREAA